MVQGLAAMMGARRGSTLVKCAMAEDRSVPVVAVGGGRPVLLGEDWGRPFGME